LGALKSTDAQVNYEAIEIAGKCLIKNKRNPEGTEIYVIG
jgi:hypothetical protein